MPSAATHFGKRERGCGIVYVLHKAGGRIFLYLGGYRIVHHTARVSKTKKLTILKPSPEKSGRFAMP